MRSLSFKQLVYGGIGAILIGFLGAIGWDIYLSGKEAFTTQILQFKIPTHWLFFGGLMVVGIILLILALVRRPKVLPVRPASITELLIKLIEFQSSWSGKWRPLIKSGELRPPESGEIFWYSNQIRSGIARIQSEGLPLQPHLKGQLSDFADDAGKLGQRIRETFPGGYITSTLSPDMAQSFFDEGDSLAKRLENIIPQLEEAFPVPKSDQREIRMPNLPKRYQRP